MKVKFGDSNTFIQTKQFLLTLTVYALEYVNLRIVDLN